MALDTVMEAPTLQLTTLLQEIHESQYDYMTGTGVPIRNASHLIFLNMLDRACNIPKSVPLEQLGLSHRQYWNSHRYRLEICIKDLAAMMRVASGLFLAVDLCTHRRVCYLAITFHMILSSGHLSTKTLAYSPFDARHKTKKDIADSIKTLLEKFQVPVPLGRFYALVTDGGSNVKGVGNKLGLRWLYCAINNF
jgi:hypothetical protein